MAAKVRGITIEIGGDASGLDKALKDVNSSIKSTQSQLKDVNKLLKLDPGNAELLAQKQKLLAKATEETASKLKTLKDAAKEAEKALANGEIGQEQYDALKREIISCETEMRKLGEESEKTSNSLKLSGNSVQQFAESAKVLADKTKVISAAAAGAVVALGAMAVKAGQSADDINTLSKQTGLATDTIQKMQYAAERIDVPVETINSAVKKLKNNLDKQADVWDSIHVSVKNSAGEYRNIEDIFNDTVKALGNIKNETERDTIAMDLFGKSADELAGLLDDGGEAFRRLGQEAQNKGLLISQEDLDAANELNDAIDGVKASFSAAFSKSGAKLAQAMIPVIEKLGEALGKVAEAIANIPTPVITILSVMLLITAAFSPLLSGIASLIVAFPAIQAGIMAINGALATLLANPVVLIIAAIVAAIAVLAIGIYELVKHWDEVSAACSSAVQSMKQSVSNTDLAKHVKSDVNEIKSAWENAGGGIKGAFASAMSATKNYYETILQQMTGISDKQMQKIEDSIIGAFNAVVDFFKSLPRKFADAMTQCVNAVKNIFTNLVNSARQWGTDLAENFTSGINRAINKVKTAVEDVAQSVKDVIGFSEPKEGPLSNFHTFAPDMIDLWVKGINDNLYRVKQTSNTLAEAMSPNATMTGMQLNQQTQTNNALNSIYDSLGNMNQNTTVNVVLEGDAKGVFRLVRQENAKMVKSTGYHALA